MRGTTAMLYMILLLIGLLGMPFTILRRDLNGLLQRQDATTMDKRQIKGSNDDDDDQEGGASSSLSLTTQSQLQSQVLLTNKTSNTTTKNNETLEEKQVGRISNSTTQDAIPIPLRHDDNRRRRRPLLPSNATGRAFICITGQVKRLVAEKIRETVLEPLRRERGYTVDVALAMSDDALHWTNGKSSSKWRWNTFTTYQQVHDYFTQSGFRVVTTTAIVPLDDPPIPRTYLRWMDKEYMSDDAQRNRVQNHARQFQTLAKCHDAMLQQQQQQQQHHVSSSTDDDDKNNNYYYDFSIRLREDVSFNETIDMDRILPLLYPNKTTTASSTSTTTTANVINGTVLGTDCRTFGGINDRMAIISRRAFYGYYHGPWDFFLDENDNDDDDDVSKEGRLYKNPETYLKYVYSERLHLNVVRSKHVRGVIKYVVSNDGTDEEPHLTIQPARGENFTYCPGDPHMKRKNNNSTAV